MDAHENTPSGADEGMRTAVIDPCVQQIDQLLLKKVFLSLIDLTRALVEKHNVGVDQPILFKPQPSFALVPNAPDGTLHSGQITRVPISTSNDYIPLMEMDQAGPCTVALANTRMHSFFVLKKKRIDQGHESRLVKTEHQNVVNLESFLQYGDTHALVYESCSISLSDVQYSGAPPLEAIHLSAVAKQVTCPIRKERLWARLSNAGTLRLGISAG